MDEVVRVDGAEEAWAYEGCGKRKVEKIAYCGAL